MWLTRLAFWYLSNPRFTRCLGGFGPKLDPSSSAPAMGLVVPIPSLPSLVAVSLNFAGWVHNPQVGGFESRCDNEFSERLEAFSCESVFLSVQQHSTAHGRAELLHVAGGRTRLRASAIRRADSARTTSRWAIPPAATVKGTRAPSRRIATTSNARANQSTCASS